MKTISKIFATVVVTVLSSAMFLQPVNGQSKASKKSEKDAQIENAVNAKKFTFIAQSASPMAGGMRNLTSEYSLRISGDSIISYLPYFGRAYSAPIDLTSGGFNFLTTASGYELKNRRKGGWSITIRPKSPQDVQMLSLTISPSGSASLTVTSNNRQPISFNGFVR